MSRRRQSVNILTAPGPSAGQHHNSNHLHDSAPVSLNVQQQQHEKRSSNSSGRHGSMQHRRVSSVAAPSASNRHSSMNMVGASSPDRPTQKVTAGRRHSSIDPRAVKEAARRASDLANSSNPYNLNHHTSMPRVPSSDMVTGVDNSNHSRDRDRIRRKSSEDRTRRTSSEKDQLPSKYNRFDVDIIHHGSHGSGSLESSHNSSGNLKSNRAGTSKQIKNNRSRDLQSLAELGLELQEELNASGEADSGFGASDVAKVEPSKSKKSEGLSTNSGRSLDIDLDSVEAKAIIKLQSQLKHAQAEIRSAHQKSSELSLDNAERGVKIHELTQQVKELLLLNEQAKDLLVENENLQRKVKRGSGEAAVKVDALRQDNDMLRREIDKLRKDNQRLADQRGELKNEVSYLRKEREGALLEVDRVRMDAQRMADQKNELKKEIHVLRKDREAMKDKIGRTTARAQNLEGENRQLVNELAKSRSMLEKTEKARRAQEDLMAAKMAAASMGSASAKHHRSVGHRGSIRVTAPPPPSASDGVVKTSLAPGLNDDLRVRNGRR